MTAGLQAGHAILAASTFWTDPQPFVGAWADFNTLVAGSISISSPAPNQVQVDYVGIGYESSWAGLTTSTFSINFDSVTGVISLLNLSGIGTEPLAANANMFLGISQGTGATNPRGTPFALGGPNATASPTDMIYGFGHPSAALAGAGVTNIIFTPSGSGYTWRGT